MSEPALPVTEGKKHLPQPMGPHSVGFVDVMTPGPKGIFTRVYYPTTEQCLDEHKRWPLWAEDEYITGFLTFMQAVLSRWPSWAPRKDYKFIDQMRYISPFVPKSTFPFFFKQLNGNVYVPIIEQANLSNQDQQNMNNQDQQQKKKWPLIIFSHGLGCARFTYSRICYDLASYGFIVAAVEHRDGSSCLSFHMDDERSEKKWIEHRRLGMFDDEYKIRNEQVNIRAKEVQNTLDFMLSLNDGLSTVENILPEHTSSSINHNFSWSMFKGAIDADKVVMTGHSFGGATTLMSLANDKRFRLGIVMDGWLFPLKDEELQDKVSQPLLLIDTESFITEENLSKKQNYLNTNPKSQCFCIKGSVHQNHMDTPIIFKDTLVKKVIGMHSATCPETVISLNNRLTLQFIFRHLGLPNDADIDKEIRNKSSLLNCFNLESKLFTNESSCECNLHKKTPL